MKPLRPLPSPAHTASPTWSMGLPGMPLIPAPNSPSSLASRRLCHGGGPPPLNSGDLVSCPPGQNLPIPASGGQLLHFSAPLRMLSSYFLTISYHVLLNPSSMWYSLPRTFSIYLSTCLDCDLVGGWVWPSSHHIPLRVSLVSPLPQRPSHHLDTLTCQELCWG